MYWICRAEGSGLMEGLQPSWSTALSPAHARLPLHILLSPSWALGTQVRQPWQPHPCSSPHLWLLEELAALLILDVGDLPVLDLGVRATTGLLECQQALNKAVTQLE